MSAPGSTVSMDEYHAALDRRDARERELRKTISAVEHDRDDARTKMVQRGERLTRVQVEAEAIAAALGERGLIDFADDVRMLAKLASSGLKG